MERITLLHNPGAGDEDHGKNELKNLVMAAGFECRYLSTKDKNWKDEIDKADDLILIAGGDGTLRKVTKQLLKRQHIEKIPPIALLPIGTANNIARTLGIDGNQEKIISSLHRSVPVKFDVGIVTNIEDNEFFLESFGYGIFPYLMLEIRSGENKNDDTDDPIERSLKLLLKLIDTYKGRDCKLLIDGVDHSGHYLLAEVMNTKAIGPNLFLAPDADTGDGEFDVVLISNADKPKFADYIAQKIEKPDTSFPFKSIRAKKIEMSWQGTHVHADDETIKLPESIVVNVQMKPGLLEILLPGNVSV